MASKLLLVLGTLLLVLVGGCRPKKVTFEDKVTKGITTMGITVPAAKGATLPLMEECVLVFIAQDYVAIDSAKHFVAVMDLNMPPSPDHVLKFDPARAGTEGAGANYKRQPDDPLLVPLANALSTYDGKPKCAALVAGAAPPAELQFEVFETLIKGGYPTRQRVVRFNTGVALEPVSK